MGTVLLETATVSCRQEKDEEEERKPCLLVRPTCSAMETGKQLHVSSSLHGERG